MEKFILKTYGRGIHGKLKVIYFFFRQKRPAETSGRGGGGGGRGGGSMGRGGGGGGGGGGGRVADSNVNDWPGTVVTRALISIHTMCISGAAGGSVKRARPSSVGMGSMMGGEEALLDVNEQNKKSAQADNSAPEMIGTGKQYGKNGGRCYQVDFVCTVEIIVKYKYARIHLLMNVI